MSFVLAGKMHIDQGGDVYVSVKDIAQCVAPDNSLDAMNRTLRQLRHWTQSDILRPASAKNTGTGTPRIYPEEPTLFLAAVLLELHRYGATVDIMKPVAEAIYDDWVDGPAESQFFVQTDEATMLLQLAWTVDPETARFKDVNVNLFHDYVGLGEGKLDIQPCSSIVLNLNQIYNRIDTNWYQDKVETYWKKRMAEEDHG
jgi:hypothetical protein